MSMSKDPFTVLGVPYDASLKEISIAYRRLAREHHPDVNGRAGSIESMQEINWAYEVLSNPEKRRTYYSQQHARANHRARNTGSRQATQYKATGAAAREASYPSPPLNMFGGTADRAIVGAVAGLVILGVSLIFGMDFVSIGAFSGLIVGVWIGSGPNSRISSQNGIGVGGVVGLFYGAVMGLSIFGSFERTSIAGALLICTPSMILLGAALGALLGGLAAGLRRLFP